MGEKQAKNKKEKIEKKRVRQEEVFDANEKARIDKIEQKKRDTDEKSRKDAASVANDESTDNDESTASKLKTAPTKKKKKKKKKKKTAPIKNTQTGGIKTRL